MKAEQMDEALQQKFIVEGRCCVALSLAKTPSASTHAHLRRHDTHIPK